MLHSSAAWIQLSFLSSYPKSAIHRALQGGIPLVLSCTPWDISLSLSFCRSILPVLLWDNSHIMKHPATWLRIHAVWQHYDRLHCKCSPPFKFMEQHAP